MESLNLKKDEIQEFAMKMGFKGTGNKEDPILFKSSEDFPEVITINDSDLFIIFEKCNFYHFIVKKCKNFSYNSCEFEILQLERCSQINIKDCKFKGRLILRNCIYINTDNCFIKRLDLIGSYENVIKNSTIDEALNTYSSGNIFQNIQIPDEYINYLLKGKLMKKLLSIALPVLILVTISSTIRLWNIDLFGALLALVFLSMCILLVIIMHYLSYKKMKKYAPNKIL